MSVPKKKIVICTNSLTAAHYEAYANHNQFWFKLGQEFPDYQFIKVNPSRMSIDRCRNLAAAVAIEYNCDYILWLDDDVIVPLDGFRKLLNACEKGAHCAAGNVIIRGYPFDYMAFSYTGEWGTSNLTPIKEIVKIDKYASNGMLLWDDSLWVQQVGAVGFSFCLIDVESLKLLEKPYFVTAPNHTEDVYYCLRLYDKLKEKAKIVVDWSVECQHLLWMEPMAHGSRLAYKEYFEKVNPHVLLTEKVEDKETEPPATYQEVLNKVVEDDLSKLTIDYQN